MARHKSKLCMQIWLQIKVGGTMKPIGAIVVAILVAILSSCGQKPFAEKLPLKIGAEFSQCTCAAYVAYEKGWYTKEGFEIVSYQSYVTGGALSSAIAEGCSQGVIS